MKKPCALKFIKTLRLAMILVCLFVMSCSKEEDPEGAASSADTSTSPNATPGSTGSGNDGTGIGVIAPDIRRGINTQQFFIDKVVGNQNNLFSYDSCEAGAADSQGNHYCGGGTARSFNPPYANPFDPSKKPDVFLMKTSPSGEILWVFTIDETFASYVLENLIKKSKYGAVIDHNIVDVSGEDVCIDIQIDEADNIYCLNKHMNSSVSESGVVGTGTLPSFSVMKLNTSGELLWIRQFSNQFDGAAVDTVVQNEGHGYYSNPLFEDNSDTHTINLSTPLDEIDGEGVLDTNEVKYNESLLLVKGMTLVKDQLFIYGSTKHELSAARYLNPTSSPSDEDALSRGLIIGMSINGEFDFIYQIPTECESNNDECDTLGDGDGDGIIEAYYDETSVVDIKYYPASDTIYVLGNIEDYDDNGALQSKYHAILRFDESINNHTYTYDFKNYMTSSGNYGGSSHAWCKKLDVDLMGNVYCAGVTNIEIGIDSDKGKDEFDETLSDDDIFYAKLHYLGYLEWVYQLDTQYENEKSFLADSTGNQNLEDLIVRDQNDIFIISRTESDIEDIVVDGEFLKDNLLTISVDSSGGIKKISQWGKEFFSDTVNEIYPKKLYKYGEKLFLAGFFVNKGNSFCNDIQINEDLESFAPITGFLGDFSYWENNPEEVFLLPCPLTPSFNYATP